MQPIGRFADEHEVRTVISSSSGREAEVHFSAAYLWTFGATWNLLFSTGRSWGPYGGRGFVGHRACELEFSMKAFTGWISVIPYEEATGKLKVLYDRIKGPTNDIDNIMLVHSLRPHSMEGHMALYKNVLHHHGNTLPKWLLEVTGVYVSVLNGCEYCVEHHYAGLCRLLQDDARARAIRQALESRAPEQAFGGRELATLRYAQALTETPAAMKPEFLADMRAAGMDDGEILEVNQVVSYFAYANRTVLGLGVTTQGDILGLSPGNSDDPDNWSHQ